jgi:hypothetical protein
MSQPGKKLNQVSTHKGSLEKTLGKIVNGIDDRIFFRLKCRVAVEDRQSHRCRSATEMLIPSRGTGKQVIGQKESFRHLRLKERFN